MLVETDVLLAVLNRKDPLRSHALKALDQADLLSPFSLLELHLLERAEKLEIADFRAFARGLTALLTARAIETLADKPAYHADAAIFRARFGLTFFDSLHAAVAKVERQLLASFDRAYDTLAGRGVRRLDPRRL